MQHAIDLDSLGPNGEAMLGAIEACVHCGFCLPSCPTYVTMGEEMDSPRGRIFLMKEVLEGSLELEAALPHVDACLGCQACETACPSGVQYGELLAPFRELGEAQRRRDPASRIRRALALRTLPFPGRFRIAARLGALARPLAGAMPAALAPMLDLLPAALPRARPLPPVYPALGERRARVALLAGCAQQVLDPDINWATLKVLARHGVETVIPPGQGCCGSLALHVGEGDGARALARANLAAFGALGDGIDAVVTNAAGCGSGMGEYGALFAGQPEEAAAVALAGRVMDVSVFLAQLGAPAAAGSGDPGDSSDRGDPDDSTADRAIDPGAGITVAYHDACHLAHAQGVRAEPRALLGAIPGVELLEPVEWELCCGSAGIYNVEHPETAAELGARKAANLAALNADVVVTSNIGCMTQLRLHLARAGVDTPVMHTMQLLQRIAEGRLSLGA